MAVSIAKMQNVWLEHDDEGFREYHIVQQVQTTTPLRYTSSWVGDGPQTILSASGIPAIGSTWQYGNENDLWAFCLPTKSVRPMQKKKGEPVQFYTVESTFSTKPLNRCMTTDPSDPLLEPQKVRGNSIRYTLEAYKNRLGEAVTTTSHELFHGPQVEFDGGRDQVVIEQNVAALELGLVTSLRNNLNDDTLWGLASRRVKFSDFSWEELWYGTCIYYYKRMFVFDIRNNDDDLFDRKLLSEGTKVINGHWARESGTGTGGCGTSLWDVDEVCGAPPDPDNPQHFTQYKDLNDENAKVILDANGLPADSMVLVTTPTGTGTIASGPAAEVEFEYYNEADLTQLNIPTDLDFGTAT